MRIERRHHKHERSLRAATNKLLSKYPKSITETDKLLDPLFENIAETKISICLPSCNNINIRICSATGNEPIIGKECLAQKIGRLPNSLK